MSATTALQPVAESHSRRRNVPRQPGWQNPVLEPRVEGVSDRYGPKLEAPELVEIAECFLLFDLDSLGNCRDGFRNIISGKWSVPDPSGIQTAMTMLQTVEAHLAELRRIRAGQLHFHKDVLKNKLFIDYTDTSLSALSAVLDDQPSQPGLEEAVRRDFDKMLTSIASVPDSMVFAAARGLLDGDTRSAIRRRWIRIREMCQWMEGKQLLDVTKMIPTWPEVAARLHQATPNPTPTASPEPPRSVERSSAPVVDMPWITTLLWGTFISSVVLTIPFLWKAYEFSSHEPGTREDADFWFMVQGSASQLIGLFLSAVGMWKQSSTSPWTWMPPTIFAALCNVVAIPLYLFAPTEWSSFAVVVAGAIQSFLILLLAIAGE